VKAQLLFYQDTYKGGVTSDGYSYFGVDYLQPDTINFQLQIQAGSTIRKAFLLSNRIPWYAINETHPLLVNFNNTIIQIDSSCIVSSFYAQSDIYSLVAKDVTALVQNTGNKLITPCQSCLMGLYPNSVWGYDGFILVVMYNNSSLPSVNTAVFLNNQDLNPSITHTLSNINPINNTKDVGLSIWVNDAYTQVDTNQKVSFTLQSSQGTYLLGTLNGWNGHINKKTLPGSFYYENNTLTGLVDDINSPFIDSTDAIANIKTYVTNNATNFDLISNGYRLLTDIRNAFILAYSSPCPARSNKDTTIDYTPICSGGNVQLNGTSIGTYSWSAANNSLNNYNIPNPIANPTVTTTYIALVDSNGCKHTEHYKVPVYTTPKADSAKTTIGICGSMSGTATIITTAGSPTSYTVNNMIQSSPTFTNLAAGTYTFALSDNNGCNYISPKAFIIKDTNLAKAVFYPTPTSGCEPLSVYCANFSNNISNVTNGYVWYVNNDSATTTNFNYTFTDTGTYTITLLAYETIRSCSATTTQTFLVKDCPPDSIHITVPNIFSPNADGINDTWQLIVYNFNYTVSNYECLIYDRWGIKVFETNNINTAWDGKTTSGMPSSAGTYYYIIKLMAANSKGASEARDFKGYLELVR
jgi:gliding motility-associated-like protein